MKKLQFALKLYFYSLFLILSFTRIQAQSEALLDIRIDVIYLASDDLEGRETGTRGEVLAAEYIAHRMAECGLEPKGSNAWYQEFDFSSNPHGGSVKDKKGMNVLGYLNNNKSKTLVIGAHYDHLGYGAMGSRSPNEKAIHNGADDNASGIASLLYLAAQCKKQKHLSFNVLFIAFSGEELGLLGSKAFMENPVIPQESMLAMINMDMVGRLNAEQTISISGVGTAREWREHLDKIKPEEFTFNYSDGGIGPSDHTSFYLKNIPALHFFTGQHMDYHKPSDDSPLVNYKGIAEVSNIIWDLVLHLSSQPALHFQKTKDESPKRSAAYKVTMGVMPDYVFNGDGMRIDAVIEDRPAHKAGLLDGDIVLELGNHPVRDVYGYMEALGHLEKGQKTTIKIKRKDEVLEMEIEF